MPRLSRVARLGLLAVALLCGGGCAAVYNVVGAGGKMKVYGGTRAELECPGVLLFGPGGGSEVPGLARSLSFLATLDLPFTVVVDTLTLPITIPASIFRDTAPPPDDPPE